MRASKCWSGFSGLSPRVRGNLRGLPAHRGGQGSIPARAGEPQFGVGHPLQKGSIPARAGEPRPTSSRPGFGVYPRACGGTCREDAKTFKGSIPARAGEPNPRLECCRVGSIPARAGEPTLTVDHWTGTGSIPARAGEPFLLARLDTLGRVYPRACGGTKIRQRCRTASEGLSPRVRGNLEGM